MSVQQKQPYIGAPVTLISSLDVRYEGTLFTIDPNESTVALQEVKCLGTEDRQSGDKSIPKSDTVYEFIIFRGENIKSICLSEAEAKPKERHAINDPSILRIGPSEEPKRRHLGPQMPSHAPKADPTHWSRGPPQRGEFQVGRPAWQNQPRRDLRDQPYQQHRGRDHSRPHHYQQPYHRRDNRRNNYRGPRQHYRRNNYRGPRRWNNNKNPNYQPKRSYHQQRNQDPSYAPGNAKFLTLSRDEEPQVDTIDEEFDFMKANQRFDKDTFDKPKEEEQQEREVVAEPEIPPADEPAENPEPAAAPEEEQSGDEKQVEEPAEVQELEPPAEKFQYKYDPANFFDNLDSGEPKGNNKAMKERRKKDAETFGKIAEHYSPKIFRRRRYKPRRGRRYHHHDNRRPYY